MIQATPWGAKPHHLLHDHDAVYGRDFRQRATTVHVDAHRMYVIEGVLALRAEQRMLVPEIPRCREDCACRARASAAPVTSTAHTTSPPGGRPVLSVQVDWLLQAFAEPAANRCPALVLAVIGDQAAGHRRGIERVFDIGPA